LAVKVESICLILYGFVRATEAKQVRGYDPMSRICEERDHLAIEVAPCGFAMEAKEDLIGVPRPIVQVVKAHPIVPFQVFHVIG
jgi:hypothetical protein